MTELDEYENNDETPATTIPTVTQTVEQCNRYKEEKLKNIELQAENWNIYARLLKSNEQISNLVNMVTRKVDTDTLKADLEEHKNLLVVLNKLNKMMLLKLKITKESTQQFIETIELF